MTRLRAGLAELEGSYLHTVGRMSGDVSESLSRSLHALSVWLSREMEFRYRTIVRRVGERVQTEGFDPYPLQHVPRLVDARLRFAPGVGASPAFGRPSTDTPAARQWLREVLTRARTELRDEVVRYFADLHSVMALTLDEVVARRLDESDAHLAETGTAVTPRGTDDSGRGATLARQREILRNGVKQIDHALIRYRQLPARRPRPSREADPGRGTMIARRALLSIVMLVGFYAVASVQVLAGVAFAR